MAAVKLEELYIKRQESPGEGLLYPNQYSEVTFFIEGHEHRTGEDETKRIYYKPDQTETIGEATRCINFIWHHCLLSMKVNEVCSMHMNTENVRAFLRANDDSSIASGVSHNSSTVVYRLKLEHIVQNKDIWEMDLTERFSLAKKHKETGNELYAACNYLMAGVHYSKAAKLLVTPETSSDEDAKSLKSTCRLNLAACQLKREHYESVTVNCSAVLVFDDSNVKALYRRSQALYHLGKLDEALRWLGTALELEPNNSAVSELMKTVRGKLKDSDKKMSKALKSMFN